MKLDEIKSETVSGAFHFIYVCINENTNAFAFCGQVAWTFVDISTGFLPEDKAHKGSEE